MPLPQVDTYSGQADLSSQGDSWATITPADGAAGILSVVPKAIWCDVGGTVTMAGADGNSVQFTLPAGMTVLRPRKIFATGTAATGIKAIY